MVPLQPNKRHPLLTSPERLTLLTVPEKEGNVLEETAAAALIELSEEMKRGMEALSEAIKLVCNIEAVNMK